MNRSETQTKVTDIIASNVQWEDAVKPEDFLEEDLGMDSMDKMCMVAELESWFDIKIRSDDSEGFKTVQDVLDYVERETSTH